jgi:Aspartyl protease
LSKVYFNSGSTVGTLILDTGAEVSVVSSVFAAKAGLTVTPHTLPRRIRTPGSSFSSTGTASLPLTLQLLVDVEGMLMHWDRHLTLHKVWVVDVLTTPPRDLYISFADWQQPTSRLG